MYLQDKRIVVTGGTGSMGRVLIQRILTGELGTPAKVIVFSRDEAKQHQMRVEYLHRGAATDEVIYRNFQNLLEFRIGDVTRYDEVCLALRDADIVVNAAALKQVPTCEYFPYQAVMTNCIGPNHIVRAIAENDLPVETVLGISTDKACKPINVMGMTKALQERIFLSANVLLPNTRFLCVRYGNVLASRGSVIPLFHEQIRTGGPVTVTAPYMTRFLLSINQAVDLVFRALQTAHAGEVCVPRIPAATIENIARALVGDRDIEIKVTGIRPGEKIHEIMISQEEAPRVFRRGPDFVIPSLLPELQDREPTPPTGLTEAYSSADTVLSLDETRALLQEHGMMVTDVNSHASAER